MSNTSAIKQYAYVTANYWAFTLTDGALRMLVVLFFHQLGYSPFEIAMLFILYELFGVITNLFGGWLASYWGLNKTMHIGISLQLTSLLMLSLPEQYLSLVFVMLAQALSGAGKDLNKMSAKSAIKWLVPEDQSSQLFKWVAALTGSKNTLKGIGFFLGGALMSMFGFQQALWILAGLLFLTWAMSLTGLRGNFGQKKYKPKFSQLFAKSREVNLFSAARMCLFAARDVWFVVALPVYLAELYGWQHWSVGMLMAIWVILYGFVQVFTPKLTGFSAGKLPVVEDVTKAVFYLAVGTSILALLMSSELGSLSLLIVGLFVFGFLFAINSSIHSFYIVYISKQQDVTLDVGFYYMANAGGRLIGTILSGLVYQQFGLAACLWFSVFLLVCATLLSWRMKS